MRILKQVEEYYTDILSHNYEPEGDRIAAGTTTGKLFAFLPDLEATKAGVQFSLQTRLPGSKPVNCLLWGLPGIFVASKDVLYFYRTTDESKILSTPVSFDCYYDCKDLTIVKGKRDKLIGACRDNSIRIWDVATGKICGQIGDKGQFVEVIRANNEFIVTGGQNGKIQIFDSELRSPDPVKTLKTETSHRITGVDISRNSTWLAVNATGGPEVYNLGSSCKVSKLSSGGKSLKSDIFSLTFDPSDHLWWGGRGGKIYKTEDYFNISNSMTAVYGAGAIHHVYSIATSTNRRISVAGSAAGILLSNNSLYWDSYIEF